MTLPGRTILLLSLALLAACKLTAAQSSNAAQREQEVKEANRENKSNTGENIMSNRIHELLLRNLQEVFGEGDGTRRRAAIAELYTEDCELYVPPGKFVGREALDKFAGDLRATHPHFVYTPHGEPQALQNAAGRLAWGSGPRGEAPEYTGLDVIIVRDGKIAALYAFLDSMPPR
jgi:SnoaL-like domain